MDNSTLRGRRRLLKAGAAGAGLVALPHSVRANDVYPSKPITLVCPWTAGGHTDIFLRGTAELASKYLPNGQRFVVVNRPGASGAVGAQHVLRSAADGYTAMQFVTAVLRTPYVQDPGYHPLRDFTYIIAMADLSFGMVVRADAPWKTVNDVIAAAKKEPGKVSYATSGMGTAPHLLAEDFAQRNGLKLNHVTFKGSETALAVAGGHVDLLIDTPNWEPLQRTGKVRLLGVVGSDRLAPWPDVPTFAEQGVMLDAFSAPYGLIGPANLPDRVLNVLHDAFRKSMDEPEFQALLDRLHFKRFYKGPKEFSEWAHTNFEHQGKTLGRLGLATRTP
ncbi:MAG: tripartite tricarboxylate transporter substrate binding protein [Burkholderiaceae bacterium]